MSLGPSGPARATRGHSAAGGSPYASRAGSRASSVAGHGASSHPTASARCGPLRLSHDDIAVIVQCRVWLLTQEEDRLRLQLDDLAGKKLKAKTKLKDTMEKLAQEGKALEEQLDAARTAEERLRAALDTQIAGDSSDEVGAMWNELERAIDCRNMLAERVGVVQLLRQLVEAVLVGGREPALHQGSVEDLGYDFVLSAIRKLETSRQREGWVREKLHKYIVSREILNVQLKAMTDVEKPESSHMDFDVCRKVLFHLCNEIRVSGLCQTQPHGDQMYKECFIGSELVSWLKTSGVVVSRLRGKHVGRLLMAMGFIYQVDGGVDFTDDTALYRFRRDSSDMGRTKKTGWLYILGRWRSQRRFFSCDMSMSVLNVYRRSDDEPSPIASYMLSQDVHVTAQHESLPRTPLAASASNAASPTSDSKAGSPSPSSSQLAADLSSGDKKNGCVFRILIPGEPQPLVLSAPSEQELRDWMHVLWVSGCSWIDQRSPSSRPIAAGGTRSPSSALSPRSVSPSPSSSSDLYRVGTGAHHQQRLSIENDDGVQMRSTRSEAEIAFRAARTKRRQLLGAAFSQLNLADLDMTLEGLSECRSACRQFEASLNLASSFTSRSRSKQGQEQKDSQPNAENDEDKRYAAADEDVDVMAVDIKARTYVCRWLDNSLDSPNNGLGALMDKFLQMFNVVYGGEFGERAVIESSETRDEIGQAAEDGTTTKKRANTEERKSSNAFLNIVLSNACRDIRAFCMHMENVVFGLVGLGVTTSVVLGEDATAGGPFSWQEDRAMSGEGDSRWSGIVIGHGSPSFDGSSKGEAPPSAGRNALADLISRRISACVFGKVHHVLYPLYLRRYKDDSTELRECISRHRNVTLTRLGVSHTLRLDEAKDPHARPYQSAIESFQMLANALDPSSKLDCIMDVSRQICACVDATHGEKAGGIVIGADDLLLIFLFIIIKADVPNLYAEIEFICDYITSKQTSMGVGYYMATTQAAIEILLNDEVAETESFEADSGLAQSVPEPVVAAAGNT